MEGLHCIGSTITSSKIVMFDLDGTLIKTKSGRKFPVNVDDWEFRPNVVEHIKSLNCQVEIITNQAGVKNIKDFMPKAVKITKILGCRMWVSLTKGPWRKPNTGIIEKYIPLDNVEEILYVGDAAGRVGDFSDTDRKFAYNIHLYVKYLNLNTHVKFKSDREYFEGIKEKYTFRGYNPRIPASPPKLPKITAQEPWCMILIGPPASGKSTYASKHGATIISQDELGTKEKCIAAMKAATGNVIIDRTNPSVSDRKSFVDTAVKTGRTVIYAVMDVTRDLAMHLNNVRVRMRFNAGQITTAVPDVVYNMYYKKLVLPETFMLIKPTISTSNISKLYFMQKT